MKKSWRRKGPRPELVGVFAGLGVLAAATAVAVTLLLGRGADWRTTLQTGLQLDLILMTAFVAGLALFAGVRVAAAVRSAAGTSREHQLVQRALEIDYADPDALAEFEAVPPIRDLVAMLMAEKTQTRELGDRVETLHGELTSLGDGMQRTARDLGRMREENLAPPACGWSRRGTASSTG